MFWGASAWGCKSFAACLSNCKQSNFSTSSSRSSRTNAKAALHRNDDELPQESIEVILREQKSRVAQEPNWNRKPEPSEPFFPKPKAEVEPPEPFSRNRNRNRNRPFLLNCTEIQKNPFCRGTAGTENRNRLNRSISKRQRQKNLNLAHRCNFLSIF